SSSELSSLLLKNDGTCSGVWTDDIELRSSSDSASLGTSCASASSLARSYSFTISSSIGRRSPLITTSPRHSAQWHSSPEQLGSSLCGTSPFITSRDTLLGENTVFCWSTSSFLMRPNGSDLTVCDCGRCCNCCNCEA